MTLPSGTRVGPYGITSLVGAGGMGEVYRARDTRLGRDVAIKVLPATHSADADRLRRFEQEARAAGALNHPNILTVHDIGTHEAAPYIVSELLEGETLRSRLSAGRLAPRRVIDYAVQISRGLAAAHEKDIVHRDLKPENLFVTRDDRIKILDFGLAKLTDVSGAANSMAPTIAAVTEPGVVLGSVGYMSPEQVRGDEADHRSDIFAFGAILYEMLGGDRAFHGDSAVETMNAILKEEPPELPATARQVAPALIRILEHCLEKKPEQRFQSTRDLVFDLETLSGVPEARPQKKDSAAPFKRSQRLVPLLAALTLLATGALVGSAVRSRFSTSSTPTYRQVTFERGTIFHAWFAPDGDTIVYTGAWDGRPPEVFSVRADSLQSRPLELQSSDVLGISRSGKMAVLQKLQSTLPLWWFIHQGTLATVDLAGGAPRDVIENVLEADWAPDGQTMAVSRLVDGRTRLEFPPGTVIFETPGWISSPRISPLRDRVAFLEHQVPADDRGWVTVVDLQKPGQPQRLSKEWSSSEGLAWWPDGKEIWFAAAKTGGNNSLYALTISGEERLVASLPANLTVHDIAADGRVLLSDSTPSWTTTAWSKDGGERDISLLYVSIAKDLSDDGSTVIVVDSSEASGANYTTYLRKTDGSPAVRLDEGSGLALSPDGKWVLAYLFTEKQLILIPTGPGETRRLDGSGIEETLDAGWLDEKRIVLLGREPGKAARAYVRSIDGSGSPQPFTENVNFRRSRSPIPISPDKRAVVLRDPAGIYTVYPIDGSAPEPLRGIDPEDSIVRWADARGLFAARYKQNKLYIYRLDIVSGRKEAFREIPISDATGLISEPSILLTPDGKSYVYNLRRALSKLYIATGLR